LSGRRPAHAPPFAAGVFLQHIYTAVPRSNAAAASERPHQSPEGCRPAARPPDRLPRL